MFVLLMFLLNKTSINMTTNKLQNLPSVLPANGICEVFGINPTTFRVLMHRCKKRGIPLPPRRRVMRRFYYPVNEFAQWLWTHGEKLRGFFEMNVSGEEIA